MTTEYTASRKRSWFNLHKSDDTSALDVYIYDDVGLWGVTAKDFIEDVSTVSGVESINVHINSPGGDVFQGLAIYNFLKRHSASVNVFVDGMAASIASVIAMAGDHIVMPENAFMFVHNPWTVTAGNADDLQKEADALNKIKESLLSIYTNRTGGSTESVQALMDDETWLTANEALAAGFADEVIDAVKVAAKYDPSLYKHIPVAVALKINNEDEMTEQSKEEIEVKDEVTTEEVVVESTETVEETTEVKAEETVEVKADESTEEVKGEQDASTEEVVEEEAVDVRAEFKQFVELFDDRAADYFAKGLSLADAKDEFIKDLKEENARAEVPVAGVPSGARDDKASQSWNDLVAEHGYAKARKDHPEEYKSFMTKSQEK